MTTPEKLAALRALMAQHQIHAYIIPPTDPHQSEYIPDHWKTRQWFSGFTGSAGTVVVTANFAGVWTDSRYFIQAESELANSGIELVKLKIPHTPEYIDWLCDTLSENSVVGFDGKVFSQSLVDMMKVRFAAKGIKPNCGFDLPGQIWKDRPAISQNPVFEHPLKYAGKSRLDKIQLLRQEMLASSVDYHLLTALDDIAWLFNLRGSDVDYNPVFISYALISQTRASLFLDAQKIPANIAQSLIAENIEVLPYAAIDVQLSQIEEGRSILFSSSKIAHSLWQQIPFHCKKVDGVSIPTLLKACKDETETANIRQAMIKDGLALTRFFIWLEQNIGKQIITEVDVDTKLTSFRATMEGYVGNSFGTIAGYRDHGAIIHYSATTDSAYELQAQGLLLLDSGGQYMDGTTDITRTVTLGNPTPEEIDDYTRVLIGTIRLSLAIFPEGTKGFQLDGLARAALWQAGKNYGHGTGHGVGYFLNVHEGPQGITPNPAVNHPLKPGMIQSNEPGFYREGHYGIRLENLIQVVPQQTTEYGNFLAFQTLTLFPFDNRLIDARLMNSEELNWLNQYHQQVYKALSPQLNAEEQKWLKEKTKAF